jgi:hypothetical protein
MNNKKQFKTSTCPYCQHNFAPGGIKNHIRLKHFLIIDKVSDCYKKDISADANCNMFKVNSGQADLNFNPSKVNFQMSSSTSKMPESKVDIAAQKSDGKIERLSTVATAYEHRDFFGYLKSTSAQCNYCRSDFVKSEMVPAHYFNEPHTYCVECNNRLIKAR